MTKPRVILSAEGDRIQDLVFGSAHLRGVVGGSQLLTEFCLEAVPALLQDYHPQEGDLVISDGGSFTILFDGDEPAHHFGQQLAQLYRRKTGATLTVAKPEPWDGRRETFAAANTRARRQLAKAKREGRPPAASEQLPYAALCASCGTEPADRHTTLRGTDWSNYLCPSCHSKGEWREKKGARFLRAFREEVVGKQEADRWECPRQAEDVATGWDPRNYVAYLLADANGMGQVFSLCGSPSQLRTLSEALPRVLRESLAAPASQLMKWAPQGLPRASMTPEAADLPATPEELGQDSDPEWMIPVLPLILAGDDLFALLPAPYALDFAGQVCQKFAEGMTGTLAELQIQAPVPTLSAAVVICKAKYPHMLAHRRGERLLREAKHLSKTMALQQLAQATLHWEVILGSRLAQGDGGTGAKHRASLRPYWITGQAPDGAGLPLHQLLQQRLELKDLPRTRLEQLQVLYAPDRLPTTAPDSPREWQAQLEQVIGRVGRDQAQPEKLKCALQALGSAGSPYWYNAVRPDPRGRSDQFRANGLPDLLEAWDFSWLLEEGARAYAPREV